FCASAGATGAGHDDDAAAVSASAADTAGAVPGVVRAAVSGRRQWPAEAVLRIAERAGAAIDAGARVVGRIPTVVARAMTRAEVANAGAHAERENRRNNEGDGLHSELLRRFRRQPRNRRARNVVRDPCNGFAIARRAPRGSRAAAMARAVDPGVTRA